MSNDNLKQAFDANIVRRYTRHHGLKVVDISDRLPGYAAWLMGQKAAPKSSEQAKPAEHGPFPDTSKFKGLAQYQCIEPDAIPRREWLYSDLLLRKELSVTVAPGAVGKSLLSIAEALAMVSGKDLLEVYGDAFHCAKGRHFRVMLWNGEDNRVEMQRRITAARVHYELKQADLEGLFVVASDDELPIMLAKQMRDGTIINEALEDKLVAMLTENRIDMLSLDPFVSTHAVNENDNGAIQQVATMLKRIAQRANVAVSLVHHTTKLYGIEATVDSGRGAGSLTNKARIARALNLMTFDEAIALGVKDRENYFGYEASAMKANLSPKGVGKVWYRKISKGVGKSVNLFDAGDSVGVVTRADPKRVELSPEEIEAIQSEIATGENRTNWRLDVRSKTWAGFAVMAALDVDPSDKAARKRADAILKRLIEDGRLKTVDGVDGNRVRRRFVEVGEALHGPASVGDGEVCE